MVFAAVTEILMLITFGLTLPASIFRTFKKKSSQGKNIFLSIVVAFGYMCGMASKIAHIIIGGKDMASAMAVVVIFYIINFALILADIALSLHYRSLEKAKYKEDFEEIREESQEETPEETEE